MCEVNFPRSHLPIDTFSISLIFVGQSTKHEARLSSFIAQYSSSCTSYHEVRQVCTANVAQSVGRKFSIDPCRCFEVRALRQHCGQQPPKPKLRRRRPRLRQRPDCRFDLDARSNPELIVSDIFHGNSIKFNDCRMIAYIGGTIVYQSKPRSCCSLLTEEIVRRL